MKEKKLHWKREETFAKDKIVYNYIIIKSARMKQCVYVVKKQTQRAGEFAGAPRTLRVFIDSPSVQEIWNYFLLVLIFNSA